MAVNAQQIGQMLGGFGAGMQGRLPEFLQTQNQTRALDQQQTQQKQVDALERKKTFYTDANAALNLLNKGNLDAVAMLQAQRLQALAQLREQDPSIDTQDSQILAALANGARNGSAPARERLKAQLESIVDVGREAGIIQNVQPEIIPQSAISPTGQVTTRNAQGALSAQTVPGFQAPVAEGYEMLTPEQMQQMNLPADKQFQRNKQTQQVSQIGSGPAVQVNTGNPTEGERTAGILANRLDFAQSQIDEILASAPNASSPGVIPTMLDSVGLDYLARISNPAERQIIEAAQDDMLDAALTLGTGAAYTKEQFAAYKRSYFPQLGDDKATIEAKGRRLSNLLDAAYTKAGRGAPERRTSGGGGSALTESAKTAGVTQEEWQAMPAADRALFP